MEHIVKVEPSMIIGWMAETEVQIRSYEKSSYLYDLELLKDVYRLFGEKFEMFVKEQEVVIRDTKQKRNKNGILPCFMVFPVRFVTWWSVFKECDDW